MKKNLIHIGLFTCCLLGIVPDTVNAQSDPCGFEAAMQSEFLQNPAYETIISQLEQNPGQGAGPVSGIYEIPTVVHIIHNNGAENISDAQVSDAIAQANHQLAGGEGGFDTKIKLVLARVDPDGNCTNGINRIQYSVPDADLSTHATDITLKNLSRWNPSNFMNIWIVRTILPGSSVTGYAYFPGVNPLLDGLVIKHSFFGNTGTATGNQTNTLVHEFGHYACLYHVWGPSPATCAMWCHEEENCHVRGDRVCDTDPCIQATSTFDCHEPSSCETYSFCSEGFPVGVYFYPKDNYMSYSHSCQDRFTEGQAERMYSFLNNAIRANLWSEENRQCTGIAGYYGDNIIIDSPSTPVSWTVTSLPDNGNILISGNLTIEEGTTLTIDPDVVVRFCSNGRLIIKPGATLHLYGTLTNSCGTPWKGVEVWGNSAYSQYTVSGVNRQGRLAAYPGSVIENADIGVQLWGPDYNANAGGIISCSGTTLRNNRRGVEFAPYHNFWPFQTGPTGQPQNYSASFVRCTFVTGDDYPNLWPFEAFLYMKGVKGVRIHGNSFANNRSTSPGSIQGYGYGIHATDAGFSVQSACNNTAYPCNDYTHTTFYNLGYAVYTANVVGNQPFNVQQAKFNGCYFGIYNRSVSQGTLLLNHFNLGNLPDAGLSQDQFGTFFEAAMSGFTFEENTFQKIPGNVTNTIGSYSKDLAFFDGNVLRRNTYNGLTFGNIADRTNAYYNTNIPRGLHYLCNTNTGGTAADFSVLEGSNIRKDQGLLVLLLPEPTFNAAGNKFSHTATDFRNLGTWDITYHKNPFTPLEDPVVVSGNFSKIDATPNTCPSSFCSPPCKEEYELEIIRSEYFARKGAYNAAGIAYETAVAVGDTALTKQKEHEIAFARYAMDQTSFMVTLHLLHDTVTFHRDTLRAWFARMDNPAAQLQLARDYLAGGQASQASAVLSQAAARFQLNSEDAADFASLTDIVDLIGSASIYALDSLILEDLKAYADDDDSEAAVFARNILTMYGSYYPPGYSLPGEIEERSSDRTRETQTHVVEGLVLTASPNPSSGDVTFIIEGITRDAGELFINVTDLNGRPVWSHRVTGNEVGVKVVWDTDPISSGLYIYRLVSGDGRYSLGGKVVIQK